VPDKWLSTKAALPAIFFPECPLPSAALDKTLKTLGKTPESSSASSIQTKPSIGFSGVVPTI